VVEPLRGENAHRRARQNQNALGIHALLFYARHEGILKEKGGQAALSTPRLAGEIRTLLEGTE
jgi:hypothetical protein